MLQMAATCNGVKPTLPSARAGSAPTSIKSRTKTASLLPYRHARVSGVLPSLNIAFGLGGTGPPASASRTLSQLPIFNAAASFMSRAVGGKCRFPAELVLGATRDAATPPPLRAGGCRSPEGVGAASKTMSSGSLAVFPQKHTTMYPRKDNTVV